MNPSLQVRLLGDFLVLYGGLPLTTVSTSRLQSLLAYLVLHRSAPQPRNHIAFLLWPESAESQAQTNLRKLLHQLRQAIPDIDRFLRSDSRTLQWLDSGSFTLDVAQFDGAVRRAGIADQEGDQDKCREALQEAVGHYVGDLLPACYDDWILPERERLRQRFVTEVSEVRARNLPGHA